MGEQFTIGGLASKAGVNLQTIPLLLAQSRRVGGAHRFLLKRYLVPKAGSNPQGMAVNLSHNRHRFKWGRQSRKVLLKRAAGAYIPNLNFTAL